MACSHFLAGLIIFCHILPDSSFSLRPPKFSGFDLKENDQLLLIKESFRLKKLYEAEIFSVFPFAIKLEENLWVLRSNQNHRSRLSCVQSVYKIIASSMNPRYLLDRIKDCKVTTHDGWTLENRFISSFRNLDQNEGDRINIRALTFAIAQIIEGQPSLYHSETALKFVLIETSTRFYFTLQESEAEHLYPNDPIWPFLHFTHDHNIWKSKPHEFSSSTNYDISNSIINILVSNTNNHRSRRGLAIQDMVLYDPCCGLGTNLFTATR